MRAQNPELSTTSAENVWVPKKNWRGVDVAFAPTNGVKSVSHWPGSERSEMSQP